MTATLENKANPQISKYYQSILDGAYQKPIEAGSVTITPHLNTLFVRPDDPERVSAGGITIPDRAQQQRDTGVVIAVRDEDPLYKVGDRIMYRRSGDQVHIEGIGDLVVLQHCGGIDDNILCKFEPMLDEESNP